MTTDQEATYKEFQAHVNLTKSELEKWLKTDEAKSVGIKSGTTTDKQTSHSEGTSIGYKSGEKIIAILDTNKADLTDDDFEHMAKVTGYIKRHLKQKPTKEDVKTSRWRYSLMNWGHDPLKQR